MKAFLFSDLHVNYKQLADIANFLATNDEVRVVIFAGDVLNMGEPIGFANQFVKVITLINKPFFWVPGNNDFGRGYYKLKSALPSLEGSVSKYEDLILAGVGGSPASWAGQYAGEQLVDKKKIAGSIFVSHFPPPVILNWRTQISTKKAEDTNIHEKRRLADAPKVHICGHIHHQWGEAYLGQTKVVKLGAAEFGYCAILDTDSLAVEFLRL